MNGWTPARGDHHSARMSRLRGGAPPMRGQAASPWGGGGGPPPATALKKPGACPLPPLQAQGSFPRVTQAGKQESGALRSPRAARGGERGWGTGQGLSATQTHSNTGAGVAGRATWLGAVAGADGVAFLCAPLAIQTGSPASPSPEGRAAPGWGCGVRVRGGPPAGCSLAEPGGLPGIRGLTPPPRRCVEEPLEG